MQLDRKSSGWNLALDSQQAKGSAAIADAKNTPIGVNLQYVRLPAPDPEAQADENLQIRWPRLTCENPRAGYHHQSTVPGPGPGRWLVAQGATDRQRHALNNLDMGLKGILLQGNGGWEGAPGATNSWFKGRIGGKNLADVLKGWGFAPSVTSEEFHMDVDGRWPGSPAWLATKRFSGTLDASLNKGQFVEVEGGTQALRVFGLLNFNCHRPSFASGFLRPVRQRLELRPGQRIIGGEQRCVCDPRTNTFDRAFEQPSNWTVRWIWSPIRLTPSCW